MLQGRRGREPAPESKETPGGGELEADLRERRRNWAELMQRVSAADAEGAGSSSR